MIYVVHNELITTFCSSQEMDIIMEVEYVGKFQIAIDADLVTKCK